MQAKEILGTEILRVRMAIGKKNKVTYIMLCLILLDISLFLVNVSFVLVLRVRC